MFTGLIEEIGTVQQVAAGSDGRLMVGAAAVLEGICLGDSIAVNGVCLTVTAADGRSFTTDVMPESLRQTNLGKLHPGSPVNLERPVALSGRLDGHLVQGHVDAVGQIVGKAREGNALWVTIEPPPELMRYIVSRGFIAIDGASLTVARLEAARFAVSLVPHTQGKITLSQQPVGYAANLEADIIAKYVERLLHASEEAPESRPPLDWESLARRGFG